MGRTLFLLKPDAVERGLIGEIVSRIEARGIRILRMELRTLAEETAKAHYAEHDGKAFFADLVAFITRSPLLAMVLESEGETFSMVRAMMGATNPAQAAPGTIRGDLATLVGENLVHGSDSDAAAEREIALFFPELAVTAG